MDEVRRPDPSLSGSRFVVKDKMSSAYSKQYAKKPRNPDGGDNESAIDSFVTSDSQRLIGKDPKKKSPSPSKSQTNFKVSVSMKVPMTTRDMRQSSHNFAKGVGSSKISVHSNPNKSGKPKLN